MSDSKDKVVALEQQRNQDFTISQQSDKEKQVISDTVNLFRETRDARNQNFEFFDGLNIIEYIEDSVRRFFTNIDERDNIESWQAGVSTQFTRNKVLAILGKVMAILPIAQFKGRGEEDTRKGIILSNLYEYVEELDDYEEFMTHFLLEAIVKGTAVGYEGVSYDEKTRRNVSGKNDNITIKEEKDKITKLFGSIVPLEDFYPSSVSIRKIKDMPYCFWRNVMPYTNFLQNWGMFEKSKLVQPKRTFSDEEDRPFYSDYISNDIKEGQVELVRFYDQKNDQYILIANGVWLNPIMLDSEDGKKEDISPLPWNHKELPFWEVKFDFFGDWFYGKSLPDRLKMLQDILNVLTNMLLDQSFLTIFPPLLTNGFDSIEDDYLRPGRRTPVDTQGLPINQAFMKLDLGTPSGWHQFILEYTKNIMEEASVDQVSQGIAGVGERTTAREINVAAEGVATMLQLFARMINYGLKRKATLKAANILQFAMDEDNPIHIQLFGADAAKESKDIFNVFEIDNAVLSGGKRGTKIIEIYKDAAKLPQKAELQARSKIAEVNSGKKVEILAFPPRYLRDFKFDVELVMNIKSSSSKEIEKALQLEKVATYVTYFPQIIDMNELAVQTAEKLGDDPSKIILQDIIQPQPEPKQQGTEPSLNGANNMVRGMQGGDMMGGQAALQNQMLG